MHMSVQCQLFDAKEGSVFWAPTFLDLFASSSQWFYCAVSVSPVGERPVLVTQ